MEYNGKIDRKVLSKGVCKGFNYFILNLGTHPTAYVEIPKDHKDYLNWDLEKVIDVHGGITYQAEHLILDNKEITDSFFIRVGLCSL